MPNFLKGIILLAVIAAIIYGYAVEVPYFTNTFGIRFLIFRAVLLGVFIGWFGNRFVYRQKGDDMTDRIQIALIFIIPSMIIVPLVALFTNHFLSKKTEIQLEKVVFLKEIPLKMARFGVNKDALKNVDAVYTYFIRNEKQERIRSKHLLFKDIQEGSEVELPIKKGFWGFEFVELK
jgi:uncharacterized membrane-anchored protein